MTTLAEMRDGIADLLSRSDINTQITDAIQDACRRYSRKLSHLTEVRAGVLTTVQGQAWYGEVDLSTGASYSDLTTRTAVPVREIVRVQYMSAPDGAPMKLLAPGEFDARLKLGGTPAWFTIHAGQIGIAGAPADGEQITFSAFVKPLVPSASADVSVWFDETKELIECSAAARVCRKLLADDERAASFEALEAVHYSDLLSEAAQKMRTRIRPRE